MAKEKRENDMTPFYILFRHNKPGEDVRFSIWKEYDDTKIWDSPILEVVEYYNTRKEAQNALAWQKRKDMKGEMR